VPFITDVRAWRRSEEHRTTTYIEAKGWRYLNTPERVKHADGTVSERVFPYSGSMTTAGIAALAVGRDILGPDDSWLATPGRDHAVRKALWEGFGWLGANWELNDNPGQPGNWPFYWIYGLERCAMLGGVEFVGTHDWYHEGAVRLIRDQREDGSWPKTQRMRPPGDQNVRWWSDQVDTCFALLFLTRGTPPLEVPPPTITGGG
jgi:hypothetical protein